jgi:hypothetical protein
MAPHLGLQRIMVPSAQVSSLTTGVITLPSARTAFVVSTFGYFAGGGRTGAQYSEIRKMPSTTETFSNTAATLSAHRTAAQPLSNSGTAGYVVGGGDTGNNIQSDIQKINQEDDSRTTIAATISGGRNQGAGFSNEGTAGYVGGGQTTTSGTNVISKLTYSTEAVTTLSATMSSSDGYVGVHTVNNKGVMGYTIIRETYSTQKLSFSSETTSVLTSHRSNRGYYGLGSANDGTAGYITSGFDIPGGLTYPDDTDKIVFATETRSTIASTVTSNGVGNRTGGYYNGASFGIKGKASYHCGGYREAFIDALDKLTYATDTPSLLGTGRLVVSGLAGHVGFANSGAI